MNLSGTDAIAALDFLSEHSMVRSAGIYDGLASLSC